MNMCGRVLQWAVALGSVHWVCALGSTCCAARLSVTEKFCAPAGTQSQVASAHVKQPGVFGLVWGGAGGTSSDIAHVIFGSRYSRAKPPATAVARRPAQPV